MPQENRDSLFQMAAFVFPANFGYEFLHQLHHVVLKHEIRGCRLKNAIESRVYGNLAL